MGRLWKAKILRNIHHDTRFNALCNASETRLGLWNGLFRVFNGFRDRFRVLMGFRIVKDKKSEAVKVLLRF